MIKFKKLLTTRIISITALAIFLYSDISYPFSTNSPDNLRIPLNTTQERQQEVQRRLILEKYGLLRFLTEEDASRYISSIKEISTVLQGETLSQDRLLELFQEGKVSIAERQDGTAVAVLISPIDLRLEFDDRFVTGITYETEEDKIESIIFTRAPRFDFNLARMIRDRYLDPAPLKDSEGKLASQVLRVKELLGEAQPPSKATQELVEMVREGNLFALVALEIKGAMFSIKRLDQILASGHTIRTSPEAKDTRRSKLLSKIRRKTALALMLALPVIAIEGLPTYGTPVFGQERKIVAVSPSQIEEKIWMAVDQYNVPAKWKAFFIDYGEDRHIDLSSFQSLRFELSGKGYVVAQLIDTNHRDTENWQGGLSRVYEVKPDDNGVAEIDMNEFLDSDPELDLKKVSRIVVHVGQKLWDVTLNLEPTDTSLIRAIPSTERPHKGPSILISEHDARQSQVIERSKDEKRDILEGLNEELIHTGESKMLSEGDFYDRLKVVKDLQDDIFSTSKKDRSMALSLLNYVLMDPAQNTNLRRYVYYILKDIANIDIDDSLLEDFVVKGPRLKEPMVIELPLIWYRDRIDYFRYPDWDGEPVVKRFTGNGIEYGVERIITHDPNTDESSFECIVDRRIMKRLAYWSIIAGIDPMKMTYPIVYTESLLGIHPEMTYNIMAIHVADLNAALDSRGIALRDKLLGGYADDSNDLVLDKIIVTGLILMEAGFNRFSNNGGLALRLQGYNGYGRNPAWPDRTMLEDPMIGKRAVHIGNRIAEGPLRDLAIEVSEELGLLVPSLPNNLVGHRIRIAERLKKPIKASPSIDGKGKGSPKDLWKAMARKGYKTGDVITLAEINNLRKDWSKTSVRNEIDSLLNTIGIGVLERIGRGKYRILITVTPEQIETIDFGLKKKNVLGRAGIYNELLGLDSHRLDTGYLGTKIVNAIKNEISSALAIDLSDTQSVPIAECTSSARSGHIRLNSSL